MAPDPPAFDSARARRGLVLAVALPAAVAGGGVALVTGSGPPGVEEARAPATLARLAERGWATRAAGTPLRSVAARPGEAQLGAERLERLSGGIRPAPPARISIPAAGVGARVEAVSARRGRLEVPAVGRAGWFAGGPRPGEAGRAVVIGHRDTRTGPALFARLPRLRPGTPVAVTDRRGAVHRFRVVGGAQVRKKEFPTRYVYGRAERPVLVLITCGGAYRPGRGYRDNVLLYARAA